MKCPQCQAENIEPCRYCRYCAAPLFPSATGLDSRIQTGAAAPKDLSRGTIFADRYEIIEEIGHGGIGRVYRAFDRHIKEDIAIKLIRAEIAADQKTIERFRNEVKLTRTISHRNVCRTYDLNKDNGTSYITMEFVSGENLKSLVKRTRRLDAGTAISIAKQICDGLAEAHRLGVVHRDLKSSNVMIDKEGNAKIMDFGIARSLQTKDLAGSDALVGTPGFMSPEQVNGTAVDQRSDIYSLGVLLFEMVTGQAPFEGRTALAVAEKQISEKPKDPKELNPLIPEGLSRIILTCLEKDRENRYQSAKELEAALTRFEHGVSDARRTIPKRMAGSRKKLFFYVGAAALVLAVMAAIFMVGRKHPAPLNSIAVLPLKNLSGDPDNEYFSDGMTDALIAELSKIQIPRVISSTSVMKYKRVAKSVPEIARELKVDAVVEGSALLLENKVRITVQLIQASPERQLWADSFERELKDVLELQGNLARAIVEKIKFKLTSQEIAGFSGKSPVAPDAYVAYLRGRYFWNQRTAEGYRRAIEYFEQAIGIDPQYALAYVGLADAYLLSDVPTPMEALNKARTAAQQALAIEPARAEAFATLGFASVFDWDWQAAEREFKQALELNPNYATAHHWYGNCLAWTGRFGEAVFELERALELDPLSLVIASALAAAYYYQGRFDVAIEHYRQILLLDENYFRARLGLAEAYIKKRRYEEALAEYRWVTERYPSPLNRAWLGYGYAASGEKEAAQKILDEVTSLDEKTLGNPFFPVALAMIYTALGQKDKSFQWLERAFEGRSGELIVLKVDPRFDDLRADLRYQSLIRRMNFPNS